MNDAVRWQGGFWVSEEIGDGLIVDCDIDTGLVAGFRIIGPKERGFTLAFIEEHILPKVAKHAAEQVSAWMAKELQKAGLAWM